MSRKDLVAYVFYVEWKYEQFGKKITNFAYLVVSAKTMRGAQLKERLTLASIWYESDETSELDRYDSYQSICEVWS